MTIVTPDTVSFVLPAHKADRFFEGDKIVISKKAWVFAL
jgi:hypothetical protein